MRFGITFRISLTVFLTVVLLGGALGAFFVVEQDRALRAGLVEPASIGVDGKCHAGHFYLDEQPVWDNHGDHQSPAQQFTPKSAGHRCVHSHFRQWNANR